MNDIREIGHDNWIGLRDQNDEYQGYDIEDIPPASGRKKMTEKQKQEYLQQKEINRRNQNLIDAGIDPSDSYFNINSYDPKLYSVSDRPMVSELADTDTPFGESRYDKGITDPYDVEHLYEARAQNQSGAA